MFLVFLVCVANAVFFSLPSHQPLCIGVDVKKSKDLWGAYVVSGIGDKNTVVTLKDPKNVVEFVNDPSSRDGKFHIHKPIAGVHYLCFKATDGEPKTISFDLCTEEPKEGKLATEEELEPFEASLKKITRGVENVSRNLHFYQRREKVHRDLSERTCDRVLWVAGFKIFALASISVLQIYALKKILSSSNSNKV